MGIGDAIMAAGEARELHHRSKLPVVIVGPNGRPLWNPIWNGVKYIVPRPGGHPCGRLVNGPGARPYRRSRLFADLAENVCGFLSDQSGEFIPNVERALFNTVLDATGRPNFSIFSYEGRRHVVKLLHAASELSKKHDGAVSWLDAAAVEFSGILVHAEYLPVGGTRLLSESVDEMKRDMVRNKIDVDNLTITDLGVYASPNDALKLSTLHNAKGREFSAVAMIDMHEGKIPFYMAKSDNEIEAARRLFYVGLTRAKRVLLYATGLRPPGLVRATAFSHIIDQLARREHNLKGGHR